MHYPATNNSQAAQGLQSLADSRYKSISHDDL